MILQLLITLVLAATIAAVEHYPCAATLLQLFALTAFSSFGAGLLVSRRSLNRERRRYLARLAALEEQLEELLG